MSNYTPHQILALGAIADRIIHKLPETGGHTHQRALYSTIARLATGLDALQTLHATRSPTETEGSHVKRVMTAAQKLDKNITETYNRLSEISREGHAEINSRIGQKVKLIPDQYAAEIRAQYRAMSSTEQVKLLGELVENNRGAEFAAIVKAPGILTGLSEDMGARFEAALLVKHARAEVEEREMLNEALDAAMLAAKTAGEAANLFTDPVALAKITADEAKAASAAAKFAEVTA